ncbi:MAG: hypothetical protein FWC27_05345 [Firmicutes bacterium]|nr:hypothetical protein [Bacillota bacterium]
MEKEMKKGRIILTISRVLAIVSAATIVTLLIIYFVGSKGLGVATYLAILIPIGCIVLLITTIAVYLSRTVKKETF